MVTAQKTVKQKIELGDFQTPPALALKICSLLKKNRFMPESVVEPTCGTGNFLLASLNQFPTLKKGFALDINFEYIKIAKKKIANHKSKGIINFITSDFFSFDWDNLIADLPKPVLIIGNPPWINSSRMSLINGSNLPPKSNFQKFRGFDALTGKSNFDISEWMLIQLFNGLNKQPGVIAMLCKASVARKILLYSWKNKLTLMQAKLYKIDAKDIFNVSTDACLLVSKFSKKGNGQECEVYNSLTDKTIVKKIGFRDGRLTADINLYKKWRILSGGNKKYKWRTGIKHDCSKIMELHWLRGNTYQNGLGEVVELEEEYLYPLLKSSELFNGRKFARWVLVTQKRIGDETKEIAKRAPKTWRYLLNHSDFLNKRASSIYKKQPRFSIFGIGDYSFSRWKVAISGFYKKLNFRAIGQFKGKPIFLDDTVNFIPVKNKQEAEYLTSLLNSQEVQNFLNSLVFWDSKRPITTELLNFLDIEKVKNLKII